MLIFFKKIIYYDQEKMPFSIFIKNKIFLWQNGIDTKSISFLKKLNKINNNKINFICIGSLAKWHGIQRLIDSIINYQKKNTTYTFNINLVGNVQTKLHKEILKNKIFFNLGNKINFHGLKKDSELINIFKQSNIGVGSLGLKILNQYERSELKIREYTAAGLPFIMEANDKDFSNNYRFLFKVDKNKYFLEINDIIKWFMSLDEDIPNQMRNFSMSKLDYKKKIIKLINEIN